MAGAVLCVLRARFFRFEVRLFGTAMGLGAWVREVGEVRLSVTDRACEERPSEGRPHSDYSRGIQH